MMGKIRSVTLLLLFLSLTWFTVSWAPAQEVITWPLEGGKYYMVSSPVLPENPDPQVNLEDDLGAYKKNRWRLFRYDTAKPGYVELKTPDWTPEQDFDFGRGYWVISRDPAEIDILGEPVANNWIILSSEGDGWNQIGNIFDFDFPVVGLYVARESSPLDLKQLIDVNSNDLTYVTLQDFEDGTYRDIPGDSNNALGVGKAYWLKVKDDVKEDVILWFIVRGIDVLTDGAYLSERFLATVAQQEDPPDPPPGITISVGGSSGGGDGGCFIATATYGEYDHPRVKILRGFRDRYLSTNGFGRMCVTTYYRYSPTIAHFIAKNDTMKATIRANLLLLVGISALVSTVSNHCLLIVSVFPFILGFFLLRRRRGV